MRFTFSPETDHENTVLRFGQVMHYQHVSSFQKLLGWIRVPEPLMNKIYQRYHPQHFHCPPIESREMLEAIVGSVVSL